MSDVVNQESGKSKEEKVYESVKDLDVMEVVNRKSSTIKELTKIIKQMNELDVVKGSDRTKLSKLMEKASDLLIAESVITKVLKEKDF
jgi:hypothetical protein